MQLSESRGSGKFKLVNCMIQNSRQYSSINNIFIINTIVNESICLHYTFRTNYDAENTTKILLP